MHALKYFFNLVVCCNEALLHDGVVGRERRADGMGWCGMGWDGMRVVPFGSVL